MDGTKAYLAKPTKQVVPMTLEILAEISGMVNRQDEYQMCVYAAMLTGFYLILRCSNLVPVSTNKFNPNKQFTQWHVGIDGQDKLVMFLIEWSKTVQHCKKEMWVPVMPSKDKRVCLIHNLRQYFGLVPVSDGSPCFCFHNKEGELKALTYDQLTSQIKEWIGKTGRDGQEYTGHTL